MIYLDHNATTPVDLRVLQAMTPFWREVYGNASSRQHAAGRAASEAVENARIQAANLIGCEPRAIVFTSGATESNNLALKGAAEFYGRDKSHAKKRHLIVSAIEHPSVFEVCAWLAEHGFDITTLQPDTGGITPIEAVEQAMRDDTLLVSIMWANNETGILNDAARIGALCKSRGVFYHTDATQIVGKLPVNVESTGIDMLSFSAHKMYGPKGVGALYVRRRSPRIRLQSQQLGGGHERELRSGTLNVPGIVGLGAACEIAMREMTLDARRLSLLRDRLESLLLAGIEGAAVNGDTAHRLPHVSNIQLGDVDAMAILAAMPDVAASTGSACTTASKQSSHVLRRMGLTESAARASVRLSLGRDNTAAQIEQAAQRFIDAVRNHTSVPPSCEE